MSQQNQPNQEPDRKEARGERSCPFCGAPLIEIHCIARCTRCHTLMDTCCEGMGPVPSKTSKPADQDAERPPDA